LRPTSVSEDVTTGAGVVSLTAVPIATATSDALAVGMPVVSTVAMRGVPVGTPGKVIHVQGLSWIRYWVWFDNGLRVGTLHRNKLATPLEWERRHDVVTSGAVVVAGAVAAAEGGSGAAESIGGVPIHLIERAAAARARWAAKKG
jgi:hypothetical protein